ncbi:MAG TPA: endopeptidase La [Vicinamibacteria bacterium]|nr:endopeptidase La [Vicinamibacteria bacterium]
MFGSKTKDRTEVYETLPMVPLRDVVVFPYMMMPFVIGRSSSVRALEYALLHDRRIFLAAQHDATTDDPGSSDIYTVGTVANILQSVKLPDGNIKVLVEGLDRGRAIECRDDEGFFKVVVKIVPKPHERGNGEVDGLMSKVVSLFEQYVKLANHLQSEVKTASVQVDEPGKLSDTIASHLVMTVEEKQNLLEIWNPVERLARIAGVLELEVDKLQVDRRIQGRVRKQMERAQKEYYLNEKMKAIQKELGRKDERGNDVEELRNRIAEARMSKEAEEKAITEFKRLEAMPPMSAEATVSRNYLDWLLNVPWHKRTRESRDIGRAERVLDEDHYGLQKVKDRIIEFLAVRRLVKKQRGPILCLVGPPGVGKTSLARSVARATNRKFVRLSLGGIRDEAEIRGHRRTYIGAFPGQIIQMMKKAGTVNPLILLDEVDKMSMDFRGDPASALLEVLDPEQNHSFHDHYLDVEYDLSNAMFIATANVMQNMPQALMDRLEVIRIPGYTEEEKLEIAKRFLVAKQKEANGLKSKKVAMSAEAIAEIIRRYTREAGVRSLEREIASVFRKVARRLVKEGGSIEIEVTPESIETYLGVPKFRPRSKEGEAEVGMATGLAWTEVGGELLTTEATLMPGKGDLTITGKLGEVMQESARTAVSVIRSRADIYGLPHDFHKKLDIHLHVPEGAIPKDGPSAGITMATALLSVLSGIPVHSDVAMTGEVTLRGKVLAIGGVKEKLLAAHRAGITKIVLPRDNEKDLSELPEEVRKELTITLVEKVEEVFEVALTAPISSPSADSVDDAESGLEPEIRDEGPVAGESVTH